MENLAVDMGYTPGVLALFYKVAIGSGVAPPGHLYGRGRDDRLRPAAGESAHPAARRGGAVRHLRHRAGGADAELLRLIAFTLPQAAAIGIIGGADGPTAIYLSGKLAPELLGAIAVAAYSYLALVPLIQPPIMRALTSEKERKSAWCSCRTVSKPGKILFPVGVAHAGALLAAGAAPLLGMFCFGNLMRESGVVERLSDTVQERPD